MTRHVRVMSVVGATVAITVLFGSTALANPYIGDPVHAPYPVKPISIPPTNNESKTAGGNTGSNMSSTATFPVNHPVKPVAGSSNTAGSDTAGSNTSGPGGIHAGLTTQVKQQLQPAQLKLCNQRSSTISMIMNRANTRAQNQITLFTNIAANVEKFYTSKGKTLSNYAQLVAAVNAAETQANTDLGTLRASSTFSCSSNNPPGTVSSYRTDLQTVQTDLGNLRTAVKNLIIGVAQAEGYTLPGTPSSQGGQQ